MWGTSIVLRIPRDSADHTKKMLKACIDHIEDKYIYIFLH
jgi:hypothetical protein